MVLPAISAAIKRAAAAVRDGRGFSLIEMIVAMAVSSIILIMVYSAHRSIMTATGELTKVAAFYERVGLAIMMIDRDISCAYTNRSNKDVCFIAENNTGEPYRGKLNFVTIDHRDFAISGDPAREVRQSDVHEVGYYMKARRDHPDQYMLMKREERSYDKEPEEGGRESLFLDHVTDIKFEFKLRNTWSNSWDSRRHRKFPIAVRTSLKLKNYHGEDEDFVFISYITMAK